MNKPTALEVTKRTNEIIQLLADFGIVKFICNDGEVHINSHSMNFTFIGKFGSGVNSLNTKVNIENDLSKKITVLASMIELYSYNNGGFNIHSN
jgi:hypothetical protein